VKKSTEKPAVIIIILLLAMPLFANTPDADKSFAELKKYFSTRPGKAFDREAYDFLKKFPESRYVPDVRLMLADNESDTELALEKYRAVVKYYRYYPHRDYALYRVCQILDLKSGWKELQIESMSGIRLFPESSYLFEFKFLYITSCIMLEEYERARSECLKITEKTHNYTILARTLFLLAEIDRKTTGNSRAYIYNMRELAAGFQSSAIYPSIIFKLGNFYESKNDKDRAYSAYSDIVKNFPDSPEAEMSLARIENLKPLHPRLVKYIPDMETVNRTAAIDISPDYTQSEYESRTYYSVTVGPFSKSRDADSITALLKNYSNVRVEHTTLGDFVYVGIHPDTDMALQTKIRLAEEYGINGNIVRFSNKKNRSYIYSD
jgi:tetratricopeptide (TPR) repeat protein